MSTIDKAKLVSLLNDYDQRDADVAAAKKALVEAEAFRSDVVKAILETNGGAKKLRRAGKELTIVTRGNTYFFRGSKDASDITEV